MTSVDLTGTKVVFVIASVGFQPTEYKVPKEILEKNGIKVITVSNKPGGAVSSDTTITAAVDITLDQVDLSQFDGIFFIGGPGALEHLDVPTSYHLIKQAQKLMLPYGAICISSRILAKAGALKGLKATGWDDDLALETILRGHGAIYDKKDIVTDNLVVTANGPASAELFADGIMRVLTKKKLKQH